MRPSSFVSFVSFVSYAATAALVTVAAAASAGAQAKSPPPTKQQPTSRPTPRPGAQAPQQSQAGQPSEGATVEGVVYDSLSSAPLIGATVQLVTADSGRTGGYSATTDSAGRFAMRAVRPGSYIAGFFHPSVDSLEIEAPLRRVVIGPRERSAWVELALPSSEKLMSAYCGARQPGDSSGALVGWVRDANTGAAVPEARVVLTWRELVLDGAGLRVGHRRVPAKARASGFYAVCGVPGGAPLDIDADAPGRRSGVVDVSVPPRGVRRLDLSIADTASAVQTAGPAEGQKVLRGTASVTGSVRDAAGHPVARANVSVRGTGATGSTSETGAFALSNLPAGTRALEVRAIGYEPVSQAVQLASGRGTTARVTMSKRAEVLAPVTVVGKPSRRARDVTGFLERKQNGMGHYITQEDIEKRAAINTTDALRMVPGLSVRPNGFGYAIVGRGGCTPTVVLDGMPIQEGATELDNIVRPQDVLGIEVYSGGATVPSQFLSMANGCGVVAIWTRR